MTKALFRLFILFITCSTAISCSEQDSPELPDNPGNTNQGIASIDQTHINANGGGFIIRVKADGTWQASSSETWCTLSRASGNGNGSISGYMKANTGAERSVIITITSGKEEAQFTLKQLAGDSSNPDPDPDPEKPSGYAGRIEIPKLKGGSMNQFITHTTNIEGKEIITYSMEYDYSKKHARWVAFTFDSKTKISNVSRTDAWMYDKKIPEEYRTYEKDYKEYSRGHLCASYDRTYSLEANKQTFYYSNMSPQSTAFNTGFWTKFEQSIKAPNGKNDFVHKLGDNDTLYVVKGGYIDDEEIKYTGNHVAVPRFYFIALLLYQNGQYTQGMAYYVNQFDYDPSSTIKSYAMSIDKLEEKTHIDFFHNLPPDIESEVEAKYNEKAWFQ